MTDERNSAARKLERDHPEWGPWLTLVKASLRAATEPQWEALVPERDNGNTPEAPAPLLAGAQVRLRAALVEHWTKELFETARRTGVGELATLKLPNRGVDFPATFEAALCGDESRLKRMAADLKMGADAFQAVAMLAPLPFLQACRRRWSSAIPESWLHGYCPVCAAWPAFAEVRGIERARYLRCARCGEEWQIPWLQCCFCNTSDHDTLVSLVPQNGGATRTVEVCKGCSGYLKSFTTLQGAAPLQVMIDDLASIELDIAAVEQGYRRPSGLGYPLTVTMEHNKNTLQRLFSGTP